MYWDSFFRQLTSEKASKEDVYFLCTCREPNQGALLHEPGRKLRFLGCCSQEKACFKIRFDSKRALSRKLQIVSKPKRIRLRDKKIHRLTLDQFLGQPSSLESKSDIPSPPPPHNVARPNES